jgi:hypothetical protein
MKKYTAFILLWYYSLGTILLPNADFSFLSNLSQHYSHCLSTEDQDMDALEFITDHLINIDGIFDKHEGDDDQKPHKPFLSKTNTLLVLPMPEIYSLQLIIEHPKKTQVVQYANLYKFLFSKDIFHPPST